MDDPATLTIGIGVVRLEEPSQVGATFREGSRMAKRDNGRPDVPAQVQKRLFAESKNRCGFCGEPEISTLIIHHIEEYASVKQHDPANMIVLCANCHARTHQGTLPKDWLMGAKKRLSNEGASSIRAAAAVQQQVTGNRNIVAGRDVTIVRQSRRERTEVTPPDDAVGSDVHLVGYLKYLAKRYNQLRSGEVVDGKPFSPAFIYVAFQREFRFSVALLPISRFADAVAWLHGRIRNTRVGRIKSRTGNPLFCTYGAFSAGETPNP
jgi:5-methylcytosine-specific restriction endonuclease McrA